jgi:hypothetical protein
MAKNMPVPQFRAALYPEGDYQILEIEVSHDLQAGLNPVKATFAWQKVLKGKGSNLDWHGFRVKVEVNSLERYREAGRIVRRMLRDQPTEEGEITPQQILERLDAVKGKEVVYDPRVSDYVPIEEVQPAEFHRWADDHKALGRKSITVSCSAKSEQDAQGQILAQLAAGGHDDLLVKFVQAGKPVADLTAQLGDKAPEATPIRERLS